MDIDILQWNISFNCQIDKIADLLKKNISSNSIVCLQEVLNSAKDKLIEYLQPLDFAYSLDIRPPGKFDGKNRKLGLLTMTFGGKIQRGELINRCIFPERTLFTQIDFKSYGNIKILNFHSLTGVGYKRGKATHFASIAEFLESNSIDFFACDANEPKSDSFNIGDLEFWDNGNKGKYPSLIFGLNKVHDLEDSINSIQNRFDKLPISHKTGNSFRRYDFIFKSEKWEVRSLDYLYEEAIKATSDHALVIGKYKQS